MTALLRSEAIKLLATRRTVLAFVVALLGLVALGAVASVLSARESHPVDVRGGVHDTLAGVAGISIFIALLLGILVSTWEYQHRIMTHTLLAAPSRERVVGAKAVVAFAFAVVLAIVATALALAIAIPWLGSGAVDELSRSDLWGRVGRLLLAAGLWGALGVGIGAVVASQVGAIIGSLLWVLVVESIIGALLDDVGPWLPAGAVGPLTDTADGGLSVAGAAGMTVLYVVLFAVAGAVATRLRDIN